MRLTKTDKLMLKIFFASVFIANIVAVLFFMDRADAKKQTAKYTKKLTVTVKAGKKKTVSLAKKLKKGDKIKKVKVDYKDIAKVKKISAKKIRITAAKNTDGTAFVTVKTKKKGTIRVKVRVRMTNITTIEDDEDDETGDLSEDDAKITFKSETDKAYFDKVVAELKSQFADPDKAIKEIYNCHFVQNPPQWRKEMILLDEYLQSHMEYAYIRGADSSDPRYHASWEHLYKGTFTGKCHHGAQYAKNLAKALGFNARAIVDWGGNHEWCVVEMADASGTKVWWGINATAGAYNVKWGYPMTYNAKKDWYEVAPGTIKDYNVPNSELNFNWQ